MCFRQPAAYKEKWQKLPVVITVSYCAHLLDKEINRNCGSKTVYWLLYARRFVFHMKSSSGGQQH